MRLIHSDRGAYRVQVSWGIGLLAVGCWLVTVGTPVMGLADETTVTIQTRVQTKGSSVKALILPSTIQSLALEVQQVGTLDVTRTVVPVTPGQAVTLTALVTPGFTYTFTVKAYTSTDGTGSALYEGRVTTTVVAGEPVTLAISLGPPDPVPGIPTVTALLPSDGASGVVPLPEISATFSEPMNAATVTTTTFTLEGGGATVSGGVFFNHITSQALFTPFSPLSNGVTYTATVTTGMTDTIGIPLTTLVTWSFTVGTNTAPTANAGPDQTVFVGTTVTLDGSASTDMDGNLLTFAWSLTSVPSGSSATLSDPTAVMPTFVVDTPGTYVAQLIVNDGTVDSAPDTVMIDTTNSAPVANAGPDQTVTTGSTVTLDGSESSDVDGDSLTFAWSFTSVPSGSSATLSSATVAMPTSVLNKSGIYVAQLIVNDGSVNSAPDTVTITVSPTAYVSDQGLNSVVVIDLATETEIASIATGGDPYWIASSADGTVVATSLRGSTGVALIDATTNTLLGTVGGVGSEPEAVAVDSTGTTVYVADESGEDLYIVSVASQTVTGGPIALSPCGEPENMVISPDDAFLYITCAGSVVIRVATAGFGITTVASGLNDPHGIALNADGTRLYYTDGTDTFEYDTGLETTTGITFVGCSLYGGAVSPDGTRLYCVEEGSNLLIYDTSDGSLLATVALGSSKARDVAVHPDGTLVYVPLGNADAVEVIDAATLTNLPGNISISGASPAPRGITIR